MFKDKVECSSLVVAVASPHSIPYRITTLVTSNSSNTTLSTTTVGMRQAKTTRCRYTLKMALFNPQKQQFSIFKNGSLKSSKTAVFNYQKWHLKNISGRKKTSSRSCKNTSFSLLTNADEKLNISCKNVVEMSDIVACFQNPRPPENRVDVTKETRENNYFPYTVHTFPPHIFFIFLYFFNLS